LYFFSPYFLSSHITSKKGGGGTETDNSCLPLLLKMWEDFYRRVIYRCGNCLNTKLVKQYGEKQSCQLKKLQAFFLISKMKTENITKTTCDTTVVVSGLDG